MKKKYEDALARHTVFTTGYDDTRLDFIKAFGKYSFGKDDVSSRLGALFNAVREEYDLCGDRLAIAEVCANQDEIGEAFKEVFNDTFGADVSVSAWRAKLISLQNLMRAAMVLAGTGNG